VGDDLEDPSAIGETGCSKINSQYAIITIHGSLYRRAYRGILTHRPKTPSSTSTLPC
jgi:hypothetical protein